MNLLQMSISAGVMILVVTIIRSLTINRLPKKTFLALWGIVLVRLLLPFEWTSPLSIYSFVKYPIAEQIRGSTTQNVMLNSPINNTITPPDNFSLWIWVWFSGMTLCALYFVIAYIRCHKKFMTSQPIDNAFVKQWLMKQKCKRSIVIRQTDAISAPLTYGVFQPVILMPSQTNWTDTTKLQYILTHEYVHIRRFDGISKLILTASLCIHWFNPLVWKMYILVNRDIELSCDEKVVRIFGETIKSAYALALISMEEEKSGLTPFCNNFSKNAIEERIEAIMKIKKTSVVAIAAALCLIGGVTTAFATSASANTYSSTNTEMGTVMSRKISNGSPYQYSIDDGASWIAEADYNVMNPQDEIVWWTYDEYKSWLEEYSSRLQGYIGSDIKYKDKNGNWTVWTQERVNATLQRENKILESIKNGANVSKTINGDDSIVMVSDSPTSENIGVSYGATVTDQNGKIFDLGSFSSKKERLDAVKQYYNEQVQAGIMSQDEAVRFIKDYE